MKKCLWCYGHVILYIPRFLFTISFRPCSGQGIFCTVQCGNVHAASEIFPRKRDIVIYIYIYFFFNHVPSLRVSSDGAWLQFVRALFLFFGHLNFLTIFAVALASMVKPVRRVLVLLDNDVRVLGNFLSRADRWHDPWFFFHWSCFSSFFVNEIASRYPIAIALLLLWLVLGRSLFVFRPSWCKWHLLSQGVILFLLDMVLGIFFSFLRDLLLLLHEASIHDFGHTSRCPLPWGRWRRWWWRQRPTRIARGGWYSPGASTWAWGYFLSSTRALHHGGVFNLNSLNS